jgi:hypothetical protein
VYEYVSFRRVRGGTEETLIESVTSLPFKISILIRTNGTGRVDFAERCKGHRVSDAQRLAVAITTAIETGIIEFYHLSRGKRFAKATFDRAVPKWLVAYGELLAVAAKVAGAYNVVLNLPDVITREDKRALYLLRDMLTGAELPRGEMPLEVVKSATVEIEKRTTFEGEHSFRITDAEFPDDLIVFNTKVQTGPVQFDVPQARVKDPHIIQQFFKDAPPGAVSKIILDPTGPITVRRLLESQ